MTNFFHNILTKTLKLFSVCKNSICTYAKTMFKRPLKLNVIKGFIFIISVSLCAVALLVHTGESVATNDIDAIKSIPNNGSTEYVVTLIESVEKQENNSNTVSSEETTSSENKKETSSETETKSESKPEPKPETETKTSSKTEIKSELVVYKAPKENESKDFVYYDQIKLSREWQLYTFNLCKEYGVDYEIMLGLMYAESSFKLDNVNGDGTCFGVCQIHQCHESYAKSIGIKNFKEPEGNILLAVKFISGYLDSFNGDYHKALISYNYGTYGAKKHCFNKGIYQTAYSNKVISYANNLKK